MLTSVLVTYNDSDNSVIRFVLQELKNNYEADIKRIAIGQLFNKNTASIIVQEKDFQGVLDMLVANDITIFPFNNEYKNMIKQTAARINGRDTYLKESLRVKYYRTEEEQELFASNIMLPMEKKKLLDDKTKKEINTKLQSALTSLDGKPNKNDTIDNLLKDGNYLSIRALIKKNPVNSKDAKDKYIPAIKNCISIQLEKARKNSSYVDNAISKLEEIICDNEIKSILSEDIINIAGNAMMSVCSELRPTTLVSLINLPKVGQKINVMAAVKLSELIFENEGNKELGMELMNLASEKINIRFLLSSYDVMETVISDVNKERFQKLINSIDEMKQ